MTALHLTLTVATYPEGDRWTLTLDSGRHIDEEALVPVPITILDERAASEPTA